MDTLFKEFLVGFILGCGFWHYRAKVKELTYDRLYDWWNDDAEGKKRKASNKKTGRRPK